MRDSKRTLPNYSVFYLEKTSRTVPGDFWDACPEYTPTVEDIVQVVVPFTTLTLYSDLWLASLQIEIRGKTLILHSYYPKTMRFALSLKSTYSSKPLVAIRGINSMQKLQIEGDIWQPAQKDLNLFFQRTCINSEKHCFTNYTPLVCPTLMINISLQSW